MACIPYLKVTLDKNGLMTSCNCICESQASLALPIRLQCGIQISLKLKLLPVVRRVLSGPEVFMFLTHDWSLSVKRAMAFCHICETACWDPQIPHAGGGERPTDRRDLVSEQKVRVYPRTAVDHRLRDPVKNKHFELVPGSDTGLKQVGYWPSTAQHEIWSCIFFWIRNNYLSVGHLLN